MRVNLYLDHKTFLHGLHPLVKLGILAATFASVYGMDRPLAVAPVAVALGALLVCADATINVRRFWVMFVAVPVASFVLWTFFYGYGQGAVAPSPSRAEAVEYAAGMALKLESFLGASVLFLSITRVEEFTEALRALGMPYRMSFAIAMAFRLVPLFLSSALSVVAAQRARGLEFSSGSVFVRLARYMPVVVPVFMGALRRADAMAIALETRGFGRQAERTRFARSRFGLRDAVAAALLVVVVGGYLWAWIHGYGRLRAR
jgi:energy-coupling factor transport system permease protein